MRPHHANQERTLPHLIVGGSSGLWCVHSDWAALQQRQMKPPHMDYAAERGRAVEASFKSSTTESEEPDGVELSEVPGW